MYIAVKYKINLHMLWKRLEKLANVRILYIYFRTTGNKEVKINYSVI